MEVAGLVLTILPLCIKGVLDLNDGSHELKNYRRTMKDLATQLDVEMNKLQNTFRRLLGGLPFIYPGQLSILVSGEGWDNSVRKHLADHLGVYSTRIFESHMRTLNLLVIELASEFGLDVNSFKVGRSSKFTRVIKF